MFVFVGESGRVGGRVDEMEYDGIAFRFLLFYLSHFLTHYLLSFCLFHVLFSPSLLPPSSFLISLFEGYLEAQPVSIWLTYLANGLQQCVVISQILYFRHFYRPPENMELFSVNAIAEDVGGYGSVDEGLLKKK